MRIELNNLTYTYPSQSFTLHIEKQVLNGNLIPIIGQNGAGKSTLLKLLGGLMDLQEGEILIDGQKLYDYIGDNRLKKIGFTFQDPNDQIFNSTVLKEVEWGLKQLKLDDDKAEKLAKDALERVGLLDLADKNPYDLSLSEKKLLTIATVLAVDPEIYLFDEPMMSLDYPSRKVITQIFHELADKGRKVIVITHDMDWLANEFNYVYVMNQGEMIFTGNIQDLFNNEDLVKEIGVLEPKVYSLTKMLKMPDKHFTLSDL